MKSGYPSTRQGWHRVCCSLAATSILTCLMVAAARAAGPGVHGRVMGRDQDGGFAGLVGGATIEFKNQAGAVVARTTASPHGYYKVDLPPGQYFYSVKAPGYKDEDAGRGVRLKLSEGYSVLHFSLTKGANEPRRSQDQPKKQEPVGVGQLHGRVFQKTPGGQAGIPKALVTLRKQGSSQLVRVVTRGPGKDDGNAGGYEVVLEEGVWWASVSARGFQPLVPDMNDRRQAILIVANGDAQRDFVLSRRQPETPSDQGIKGSVRVLNQDGQTARAPNVQLQILSLPSGKNISQSFAPDHAGGFRRELPKGCYRVLAKAAGYETAKSPITFVFRGRYSRVNLTLKPVAESVKPDVEIAEVHERNDVAQQPAQVLVRVFDAAKKRPLENAKVLLRKPGQSLADAVRGMTDRKGEVDLRVNDTGACAVLAQLDGYRPGGVKLNLAHGLNRANISLSPLSIQPPTGVQPAGTVAASEPASTRRPFEITVFDAKTRKPLPGTTVQLVHRPFGGMLSGVAVRRATDSHGEVRLQIPGGSYGVSATRAGYLPWNQQMMLDPRKYRISIAMRSVRQTPPRLDDRQGPSTGPHDPGLTRAIVTVRGCVQYMSAGESLRRPSISRLTRKPGFAGVPGVKLIWRRLDADAQPGKPVMSRLGVGYRLPLRSSAGSTATDSSGAYRISLTEGRYQVQLVPPHGFRATRNGEIVLVRRGMSEKNFLLARGVRPVDPNTGRPNGSDSSAQHVLPFNRIAPQRFERMSIDHRRPQPGASSGRKPNSASGQTVYVVEYRRRKTSAAWRKLGEFRSRLQAQAALQNLQQKYRSPDWEHRIREQPAGPAVQSHGQPQLQLRRQGTNGRTAPAAFPLFRG